MRIDVYHHLVSDSARFDRVEALLNQLLKGQDKLMSKVTDFAAKEQADNAILSAKLDSIATGVSDLKGLIVTLQNTVTGLTPEEQAALDAVVASSDALVTKASAIDTGAPTGPGPTV